MTSADIFPTKLTQINSLTAPDHPYLDPTADERYFIGAYTAPRIQQLQQGQGYTEFMAN